jgi:hypothetical protein
MKYIGHASLLPAHLLPPPALLFDLPPAAYPPSFPALEVAALPGHQPGPVVVDAWISYWERLDAAGSPKGSMKITPEYL